MIEITDVVRDPARNYQGWVVWFYREDCHSHPNRGTAPEHCLIPCAHDDPGICLVGFFGFTDHFARPWHLERVSASPWDPKLVAREQAHYENNRLGRPNFIRWESAGTLAEDFGPMSHHDKLALAAWRERQGALAT